MIEQQLDILQCHKNISNRLLKSCQSQIIAMPQYSLPMICSNSCQKIAVSNLVAIYTRFGNAIFTRSSPMAIITREMRYRSIVVGGRECIIFDSFWHETIGETLPNSSILTLWRATHHWRCFEHCILILSTTRKASYFDNSLSDFLSFVINIIRRWCKPIFWLF